MARNIKDKKMVRRKILDVILNGNEHSLAYVAKYNRFHTLFMMIISVVIGINVLSVLMFVIYENIFFIMLLQFSSLVTFITFTIEFILRLIASPAAYPNMNSHVAKLKYLFSFVGILDILSVLPFVIPLLHAIHGVDFDQEDKHMYILLVSTLLLKMVRYSRTFRFIYTVFRSISKELFLGVLIAVIVVLISGAVMFYVERDAQPEVFTSVGEGFWWSVITYTTVGYGNITPITTTGKILASLIAMIGIGTIALPSGIISSAFIQAMRKRKKPNESDSQQDFLENKIIKEDILEYKYCPYCGTAAGFDGYKPFCQSCGKRVYQ